MLLGAVVAAAALGIIITCDLLTFPFGATERVKHPFLVSIGLQEKD